MTKINSDYIKANVTCVQCNSNNLKRNYKKSFKSPYNSEGDFIPETMEWRQFTCKSCDQHTNVLNNKDKIISVSEKTILPLCAFEISLENPEERYSVFVSYKDDITHACDSDLVYVEYDNIRENNILHFGKLLKNYNFYFENIEENVFALVPFSLLPNIRDCLFGLQILEQKYFNDIENFFLKYAGNFSHESIN